MTYPPEIKPIPAGTFEPHCLMTWLDMVAGADDMGDYADPTRKAPVLSPKPEKEHT